MSLHNKIMNIGAGMFSCDANGAPVDEYIARWKALEVALEADALQAELLEALKEARVLIVEAFSHTQLAVDAAEHGTVKRIDSILAKAEQP